MQSQYNSTVMASFRFQKARKYFEQLTSSSTLPTKRATVLLIGSTGNGKSTLGNFLLDPEGEVKCFATAKDNMPETQRTQSDESVFIGHAVENLGYSSVQLTVVDTPGLNESDAADLKHMIDIVEELRQQSTITACVLVVKFNSKIDMQYKKTIEYYSRLLPSLFDKNVFVVMTGYATDVRTVATRQRQGIDEKEIVENATREIVNSAQLAYDDLIVFKLDCLPYGPEEISYSEDVRSSIIEYIVQLQPIKMDNLKVAKTEHLIQQDNAEIKIYEGQIDGYKERLIEVNMQSKDVLNTIQEKERNVANLNAEINSIQAELEEKDVSDYVVTASWSVDTEWKFLKTLHNGCELTSRWRIAEVTKWTNGKCKWSEVEVTGHTFKGKVVGQFMRNLYANVVLHTEKRTKYATEISQLKKDLGAVKSKHSFEEGQLCAFRDKHEEYKKEIADLENYIAERRGKIQLLKAMRVSISEAKRRLDSLK